MKKLIPLTALALVLMGGVALADRDNHRDRGDRHGSYRNSGRDHHRGNSVGRDHGRWNRGNTVVVRDNHRHGWNRGNRVIVRNDHHRYGHRRPIYVSRPIIRERYYNYYRRPTLIVENYAPQTGYYWVAGAWAWNGAEWIWQPGHYEPDPSYIDQSYEGGYGSY
jgi:hypothetical protein